MSITAGSKKPLLPFDIDISVGALKHRIERYCYGLGRQLDRFCGGLSVYW